VDLVAEYSAQRNWTLRPNIVLVEGTLDEALFKRADELSNRAGRTLLGDEISFVAAGRRDRGGTFGVARELITLRSIAPCVLDRSGRPAYRVMGLVDNDNAGRRIIGDVLRLDRSAFEFRDIVALRPVCPEFTKPDPQDRKHECDLVNLPYKTLDWEIEDVLSQRLFQEFEKNHADKVSRRECEGDKTHYELTVSGKTALHRLVQTESTLEDLDGVVEVVKMVRTLLGLSAPSN
jgi:hypothetical protein